MKITSYSSIFPLTDNGFRITVNWQPSGLPVTKLIRVKLPDRHQWHSAFANLKRELYTSDLLLLKICSGKVMMDLKDRLLRVIQDPHFGRRERDLAKASLECIEELKSSKGYHWTELARMALLTELQNGVLGRQAATKIDSFLKRHRIKTR